MREVSIKSHDRVLTAADLDAMIVMLEQGRKDIAVAELNEDFGRALDQLRDLRRKMPDTRQRAHVSQSSPLISKEELSLLLA